MLLNAAFLFARSYKLKHDNSFFGFPLQIITFSGAIGLQSNSACLVGHLHLAHVSTSHSHTAGNMNVHLGSLLKLGMNLDQSNSATVVNDG